MITEKRLVLSHSAFWHHTVPMMSGYVRTANLNSVALNQMPPLQAASAGERGTINESGFRIFAAAHEHGVSVNELEKNDVEHALTAASQFINRFRQSGDAPPEPLGENSIAEAIEVASRLQMFFQDEPDAVVQPEFPGCGVIDTCNADVLCGSTLYEIKAGNSPFKGHDFRQLLVYAALNFASKMFDIDSICLVNPRRGLLFQDTLSNVSEATAGLDAGELLAEITAYITEPVWRDESV